MHTNTTQVYYKPQTLIVSYPDLFLKAFSRDDVTVLFAQAPDGGSSVRGELLAEQYLRETLPWWARDLLYPGYCRATGWATTLDPRDVADRLNLLALSASIQRAGEILRGTEAPARLPRRRWRKGGDV